MCTYFVLMNSAAKIRFVLGAADAPLPKEAWPVPHSGLTHSLCTWDFCWLTMIPRNQLKL